MEQPSNRANLLPVSVEALKVRGAFAPRPDVHASACLFLRLVSAAFLPASRLRRVTHARCWGFIAAMRWARVSAAFCPAVMRSPSFFLDCMPCHEAGGYDALLPTPFWREAFYRYTIV